MNCNMEHVHCLNTSLNTHFHKNTPKRLAAGNLEMSRNFGHEWSMKNHLPTLRLLIRVKGHQIPITTRSQFVQGAPTVFKALVLGPSRFKALLQSVLGYLSVPAFETPPSFSSTKHYQDNQIQVEYLSIFSTFTRYHSFDNYRLMFFYLLILDFLKLNKQIILLKLPFASLFWYPKNQIGPPV